MANKLIDQLRSLTTKQKIVFGLLLISNVLGSVEIFSDSGVIVGVIALIFIVAIFTTIVHMYAYIHLNLGEGSRRLKVYKAIVLYYFSTYIISVSISLLFLSRFFLDRTMTIDGKDYKINCSSGDCIAVVNTTYYQYFESLLGGWFSEVFVLTGFAISIPFIYMLSKHLKVKHAKLAAALIPLTLGVASIIVG